MTLCTTFRDLSYQTWKYLGKARGVNHQVLEETVTDNLMVKLKCQHPHEVITKTFTRHQEGVNGADWEWWFVDSSGNRGIGFRVQAKIINFKKNNFEQLHYVKNKGKPNEISQTELLIYEARSKGLIPLYCFYVHSEKFNDRTMNSLEILRFFLFRDLVEFCGLRSFSKEHFGCSILSARQVQIIKKTKTNTLNELQGKLIPWHLLVCSEHEQAGDEVISLPDRVAHNAKEFNMMGEMEGLNFVLPDYIKQLLNNGDFERDDIEGREADSLRGILLIREKP